MSSLLRAAAAALLCLSITGCPGAKRPPVTRSEDAMREAMKPPRLLDDADLPSLRAALGESLVWIDAQPADRRFVYGPRVLSTAEVRLVFTTMREILVDDPSPDVLEKNGRLYQSIGKLLIDEGQIPREQMSMQALRAWLLANPSEITRVFAYNPSYVFFRMLDGAPLGSLGRPVTPGRSVATDSKLFPHGALAFISTARPIPGPDGKPEPQKLGRFVLNQDTGGAIRGAGRVDVFWGRGPDAEYSAGHMKERGRLFFLVPKRVGPASP